MSHDEIKQIAESLKRRLELLASMGIRDVPGAGATAAGRERVQEGGAYAVWRVGEAAVVWGAAYSPEEAAAAAFAGEPLEQLSKMLSWLAGEIKAGAPDMAGAAVVLAPGQVEAAVAGARAVLLMGALASGLFLGGGELAGLRGRAHASGGRALVATWAPEALVEDPGLKKGAHADLKVLIKALGL